MKKIKKSTKAKVKKSVGVKKTKNNRGKFIVIEGGEGSGKSTLINLLKESFSNFSDKFLFTREPGGTNYAEAIRSVALNHEDAKNASAETLFCLMWGSRHDNLVKNIIPAIDNNINVIADRFDSATFAYQVHAGSNGKLEPLFWETRKAILGDYKPDLYIFLDLDPEIGMKRVADRKGDQNHFDLRKIDFHNNIRSSLKKFSKKVPSKVIDASKTLEEVKKDFIEAISEIL